MIPYGRQHVDDDDIAAVVRVLKGDWITQGPHIDRFEEDLARSVGARHAVTFSSGTAALHASAAVSGLAPGDEGVTTPLTFVASANCLRYVGAEVCLVDIDPSTLNIDLSLVPPTDALVAVHFAGLPVDLASLPQRPRVVIEDAAHALGATTPDGPVGNCAHSDMCVFSFHPVKHVTTGEGGAVTTNSDDLAEGLRRFRNHGMVRKDEQGGWYYEIESVGFNYRMTDLQAALGSSQLLKLDRFVERRRQIAAQYRQALADLPITLPPEEPRGWRHSYHLFPIRVHGDRRRVYDELRQAEIGVQVHYVPLHRHPIYTASRAIPEGLPSATKAYEELLSLPLFPALTDAEQGRVVQELTRITASL